MLFEGSIVDYASNALVISVTPWENLSEKEQKEKKDLIIRRNRVLTQLENSLTKLNPEDQQTIKTQIAAIRTFFGPSELSTDPSYKLGWFASTMDGQIATTIITSLKNASTGIPDPKNEALKDKILDTAIQKAQERGFKTEQKLSGLFKALNLEKTFVLSP